MTTRRPRASELAWARGLVAGVLCASLAACGGGERCPGEAAPAPMTTARAAELAPGVTRGVALSISLRAAACPEANLDGGVVLAVGCAAADCGAQRRGLEVLAVPLGASIPRDDGACPRRAEALAPLAAARAQASALGELVLPLEAGDYTLYLVDPTTGCAACGRVEEGTGCAVTIPSAGLVVRDVLLDRL
jgi:hypothetical protein